jgi:two-component system sensor histidine kinase AtoS
MRNIHFSYGPIKALDGIDFDLFPGEIHALTGDHGSGKSTLVRLLSGSHTLQRGEIRVRGTKIQNLRPSHSSLLGIGIVYQDEELLAYGTLLDNIYLGRFPFTIFGKKKERLQEACNTLFNDYEFDEDPLTRVYQLPPARRQLLSFLRVLARKPDIIILDEISHKTTPDVQEHIYRILRRCRNEQKGVIYVTSNIDEIFKIANRATILQNGHRRGTEEVARMDRTRLVNLAFSFAMDKDEEGPGDHEMLLMSRYDKRIINDIPQGLMIISPGNEIQDVNTNAGRILDVEPEEIRGEGLSSFLGRMPLEEKTEVLQSILRRKKALWQKLSFGKNRLLKIRVSPLGEEQDTAQGVLLFLEDISADYETREYLQQAEKFVSTAELAAGVAHEVNNPLGIIQNYLDLMSLEQLTPDGNEYVERMQSELSRIVEIISSLLSFSRVGVRPLHRLELHSLLDEVILLMNHKLKSKKIQIIRSYGSRTLILEAHENKLKQLFINLLSNAIEAVLREGIIRIETSALTVTDSNDHLEILITDNGHGIPYEIADQVFSPFYSTKMTRTNTGLGLSICQHIVESYNGVISVQSVPGEFTTFTVRLPRFARERIDLSDPPPASS